MRIGICAAVLCCSLIGVGLANPADASIRKTLNIPAEPLSDALRTLAKDRQFEVLCRAEVVRDIRTDGAVGEYSNEEALKQLLKGTGLAYKYLDGNTVTVFAAPSPTAAAASSDRNQTTQNASKEGDKSSDTFRVAQANSGPQVASDATPEKKKDELTEIVVTGSRLALRTKEGPQDVRSYTSEQIERSGQTTISDFLNTVPSVSIAQTENWFQNNGSTTVSLRGLPVGTTLVLINGRRVESSGLSGSSDFFDLNNIPVAAVERLEVLADGSSAVYGSDAIAGVVNVVLKQKFDGLNISATRGWADNLNETDASIAFGKTWDRGSFSVIGSYQTRGNLTISDRSLTASNDYTAFGGPNLNTPTCSPGNVFSTDGSPLPGAPAGSGAQYAAVGSGVTHGKPTLGDFRYGALNQCSVLVGSDLIPATHRAGVFAQGTFNITSNIELFTELMYSHIDQYISEGNFLLYGVDGFQEFTVSAANPFNPFGKTVGIAESLPTILGALDDRTDFFRPLVGARGGLGGDWKWEASGWISADHTEITETNAIFNFEGFQNALNSSDPSVALNPFVAGPLGPQSQVQAYFSNGLIDYWGRSTSANAFARGPLANLPGGPVDLVVGADYDKSELSNDLVNDGTNPPNTRATYSRTSFALFAEARIPIIGPRPTGGDIAALTVAGRHDHYSDFGSHNTPQLGLEIRPLNSLLVRGTYSESFKAPPLLSLYSPTKVNPNGQVVDPTTGQATTVSLTSGGNSALRPLAGHSTSAGIVFTPEFAPNFRVSVTHWTLDEDNNIQQLPPQFIVDNETAYPDRITRNAAGQLLAVNDSFANFGSINVAGLDYLLTYHTSSPFGGWSPSLSVTQTYKYREALIPGATAVDAVGEAQGSNDWAPRWKGTGALGYKFNGITATIDGRYVSKYQDYDSDRVIGNFWLFDANVAYELPGFWPSHSGLPKSSHVEIGAANIFNRQPQYSNYQGSLVGYDPAQADIRGRYIYARLAIGF